MFLNINGQLNLPPTHELWFSEAILLNIDFFDFFFFFNMFNLNPLKFLGCYSKEFPCCSQRGCRSSKGGGIRKSIEKVRETLFRK